MERLGVGGKVQRGWGTPRRCHSEDPSLGLMLSCHHVEFLTILSEDPCIFILLWTTPSALSWEEMFVWGVSCLILELTCACVGARKALRCFAVMHSGGEKQRDIDQCVGGDRVQTRTPFLSSDSFSSGFYVNS